MGRAIAYLGSTPSPTPAPSFDLQAAMRAVSEYLEAYSTVVPSPDGLMQPQFHQYHGENFWTIQTVGKRSFPDQGTNEFISVNWYVNGNETPPIVMPMDAAAQEWDAFLRGRQELVDWVQLTRCLIREYGNLIDEWNALASTPLTDAQLGEFRGREESIRDRLWRASTPKQGRDIRDKLIRSWDKSITYKDALLYPCSSIAESEELLNESNLLRGQAVELYFDLVGTYVLWGYDPTCP